MQKNNFCFLKIIFLAPLIFCFCFLCSAQISQRVNYNVVNLKKEILQNAFSGGLNAAQFSNGDFNGDGRADIFVFDRVGNVGAIFLATSALTSPTFIYSPQLSDALPPLQSWALVRDYNSDGIPDIFTYADAGAVQGVRVYKGIKVNGAVQYQLVSTNYVSNVLYYTDLSGNKINLYVNATDIPIIEDVDGDGDTDILCFGVAGSYVIFYKNLAIEKGFGNDVFIFDRADECWGRFLDTGLQTAVKLGLRDSCANFFNSNTTYARHSGATLALFDANADSLPDILVGSISYNSLAEVLNGGTKSTAWMNAQVTNFPPNAPVNIATFPAAYFVDTDGDRVNELLVCTNAKDFSDDTHVLSYKKTGTPINPTWLLQKNNFLIESMLDVGTGAFPACADINADGLTDIMVGNFSFFKPDGSYDARLTLLKNVGSATNPSFEVTDTNYLNIKGLNAGNYYNLTPTFADVDGDGDLDLIVGENTGSLIFFENAAGANKPFQFKPAVENWQNLSCGVAVAPTFFDLNKDGLPDLICGRRNGSLDYYQNIGTRTNPKFNTSPTIPFVGKVDVRDFINGPTGYSVPQFFVQNNDIQLLVGAENGKVSYYKNIQNNLNGTFTLIDSNFVRANVGNRATITLADFNKTSTLQCLVGNFRGGVSAFNTSVPNLNYNAVTETSSDFHYSISPNPAQNFVTINNFGGAQNCTFELFSIVGERLQTDMIKSFPFRFNIENLNSGTYILRIQTFNTDQSIKFVKTY